MEPVALSEVVDAWSDESVNVQLGDSLNLYNNWKPQR